MIFTIGHSTYKPEQFLEVMGAIDILVDVRSHPGSRAHPQFNKIAFQSWLEAAGKGYIWMPGLGGWDVRHGQDISLVERMIEVSVPVRAYSKGFFPKQQIAKDRSTIDMFETLKDIPGRPAWTNQGLYDYSWFMTLPEFLVGADELIELGKDKDVAICCCELLWWKCHRSMIADYLAFRGVDCVHLQPKRKLHVEALGNRLDRYRPEILEVWKQHKPLTKGD